MLDFDPAQLGAASPDLGKTSPAEAGQLIVGASSGVFLLTKQLLGMLPSVPLDAVDSSLPLLTVIWAQHLSCPLLYAFVGTVALLAV